MKHRSLIMLVVGFCVVLSLTTRGELTVWEEQENNPNLPDHEDDDIERKYDRFFDGENTDPTWIALGHDWSGIGKQVTGPNPYRWGTMISSRFCVSAQHTSVPLFNNLRFYVMGEDLDPSDPDDFVDRTFETAGTEAVEDGLDFSVAKLQTPVPDDVAVYPILILLNGLADYGGVPLFSLGSRQSRTALAMTTVIR